MNKVDVLIGMQFGSEGKGLIAGHLACSGRYDTVVNVNMPNAGHTYITDEGKEYMFKVLPNGAVSPHVNRVMLGPDSVFSLERLLIEMDMVGGNIWNRLIIHENATIMRPEHTIRERNLGQMERIGSTAQGSAEAVIDKIRREEDAVIKFDPDLLHENIATHSEWMRNLQGADNVLLEGCQGYSLGLNAGFYPYCTSRDCTPGRLAAGAGIPHYWIRRVIGAARLHPIRVGGNSGPAYEDQHELSWEELGLRPEFTTVTQRQRRIFTFSRQQIKNAIIECGVNDVFLNFCNYDPELATDVKGAINKICHTFGRSNSKVSYTGWGPKDSDIRYED